MSEQDCPVYDNALNAVREPVCDMSVSKETALHRLECLQAELEIMLETLQYEIDLELEA